MEVGLQPGEENENTWCDLTSAFRREGRMRRARGALFHHLILIKKGVFRFRTSREAILVGLHSCGTQSFGKSEWEKLCADYDPIGC